MTPIDSGDGGNPFAVQTPEDISAKDVESLFVDVFTDFHNIPKLGHTFLHGPRGSGKSMMFRYLEPDCQCLTLKKAVNELPFFAVLRLDQEHRTEADRAETARK